MPLLGQAAMLLGFDIDAEAITEHDHWHTYEHLPERLSIPGFLRGTRWVATHGAPRYMVLYEVDRLETLTSAAYLERLDHPSPWTRSMMPHYRGMTRGLCRVVCSTGLAVGAHGLLVRFQPAGDAQARLERLLVDEILPPLPQRPGLGSTHLLQSAAAPVMTSEQRIRGADAGVDWALLVTGYEAEALALLERAAGARAAWERHGASGVASARYQAACSLSAQDLQARE